MSKKLSEMSLEELWKLFPIILKEHNPQYQAWYQKEKDNVTDAVGLKNIVRISHIGSTAVKGLLAKPTVDILLEMNSDCRKEKLMQQLNEAGWICMTDNQDKDLKLVFHKGYTETGFADEVYHLHVRRIGDHDELYFRDYLLKYPKTARHYAELKHKLSQPFKHNRNGYTDAKTEFIKACTENAREEFGARHAVFELTESAIPGHLFEAWNKTMILSALQGRMGNIYGSDPKHPSSAQIIIGDFCFFAGPPHEGLVRNIPCWFTAPFLLMIPRDDSWNELIRKVYGPQALEMKRYAIKKEPYIFDTEKLYQYTQSLPADYHLTMIDEALYQKAQQQEWSRDLVSQFPVYEQYKKEGIGAAVLYQGELAAGASSYVSAADEIEIEIDTDQKHRRKGLALACGARLILECLSRGVYPGWDAHDMRSVKLAEKLGYHQDYEYITFCIERKN